MFNLFQYVGFRYLKTKPSRVLLTTLGVAFGISLYVAIAIINHSTKDALRESVESISGKSKMSITAGPAGFDESKLEIIRTSAGVKQAIPMIESRAYFQGATSSAQGLVVLGVDLLQDTSVRSYKATDQRIIDDPLTFLNQPDSIVLTQALAQKKGLIIGSKINLATTVGAKTFTVRGLLEPDGAAKAYGGSLAIMDIDGARVMFGKENKLDRVDVITLPGANTDEVKATLEKTMGSGYTVETPESQSEQMQQMLDSYQIILTFFSSLALLVGLFLVMNSISVSIAERRREIGTLRALGATRGSMVILFISEVFGISLAGSLLGCGLGRLLANKLVSQVTASVSAQFQTRIDVSHLEFTRQQFLFSVSFGVLASMIAALIPALKAAKVHPLESMKKDAESFSHAEERRSTQTIFFGLGLLVFMTVSMMLHWEKLSPLLDGFTKISSVLGAALFGPFLVFLLIRLCRRLTRTIPNGVLRLSQENLIRSRRRTTSNVMALMVGLFLVMLIGSVRTSFHNTLMDWLGRVYVADIMVSSDGRMIMADVQPIKEEIEAEIKQVPGVRDIGPDHGMGMRIVPIRYHGKKMIIKAHDHYAEFYQYRNFGSDTAAAKKLYASENPQVMVTQSFLTRQHKQVGEFVDLDTPQGSLPFKIVGIVVDYASPEGVFYMNRAVYRKYWNDHLVTGFLVNIAPGFTLEQVRSEIDARLGRKWNLVTTSNAEFKNQMEQTVEATFAYTRAIELIALLVGLLGLLNTLLISVMERTREIGMLRAVGTTRRQIVGMIMTEAALQGLFGAIIAVILGLYVGKLFVQYGISTNLGWIIDFYLPRDSIFNTLVIGVIVAIIAGILPAARAARLNITDALDYE